MKRKARLWLKLLLLSGSVIITLVFLEAGMRVRAHLNNRHTLEAAIREPPPLPTDRSATLGEIIRLHPNDRIAYELRPDMKGVNFKGAPLTSNSRGFRSPEYSVEKTPNTVTIVGIGDSIMFGHGVGDGETYIDFLGNLLREKHPGTTWRMINTAVPGYNAMMEVTTLKSKALDFEPDMVIQGLCSNDLAPPNYLRAEDDVLDLSRSFLLEFIEEALSRDEPRRRNSNMALTHRNRWKSEKGGKDDAPPRYAELYGEKGFQSALDELKAISREQGFEVLTFLMFDREFAPSMLQECVSFGFMSLNMQEKINAIVEDKTGEPFSWEAYAHSELAVSPNNLHPSVELHRRSALRIYEHLHDSGWIERITAEKNN